MNLSKRNTLISILIALSLFLAFCPTLLSTNYIRQDDLMWEIWPGMQMSEFGYLYYNIVFELVRPVCMFLMYVADLAAIDITHAVYVRFCGVIMICLSGILLYRWQLLFNSKRVLAACFATAAFTLPAYQVFAATGNYSVILAGILMTFGAAFAWYHGYHSLNAQQKARYYFLAYLLFFASLLDYPLSSMYIWVLIAIAYLNTDSSKRKLITFLSVATIKMMVFYYIFCRAIHLLYHVKTNGSRVSVIDTSHLLDKFKQVYDVLGWHSNLWLWKDLSSFIHTPIFILLGLFLIALMRSGKQHGIQNSRANIKHAVSMLAITLLFFFLSYSPILASPEKQVTFRYTITTMPILLYLFFWSIDKLICSPSFLSKIIAILNASLLIGITLFGLTYANLMVADGIVGPHTQDFASVQQQLKEKVLPLLEQNQTVVIHGIACDKEPRDYPPNVPTHLEYSMRICRFQQQVVGVIIHSLRKMGYASNFNQHNDIAYHPEEIVVNNTPWGTLVVNSTDNTEEELRQYTDNQRQIITIDTRSLPPYQHLDFYRQLLARFKA
jgi:hypothetical protein